MADDLTKEQRHKNMQHIRSKDTKIELILRKALWKKKIRYRKNYSKLPGTPDIAITKYKIAIFCDSEFFHGKNWEEQKKRIEKGNNGDYWIAKIEGNIEHDRIVNRELNGLGWTVLRFWGNEIKKDPDGCVAAIEENIMDAIINEP